MNVRESWAGGMEWWARHIFREALAEHYVNTIAFGDEVESWLKKHGGWLPDPQLTYCNGPPADEGPYVMSPIPAQTLDDAEPVMHKILTSLDPNEHEDLVAMARRWLDCHDEEIDRNSRARSRSRSRSRSPGLLKYEITLKDIQIKGFQAIRDCKEGVIAALKNQIDTLKHRVSWQKNEMDRLHQKSQEYYDEVTRLKMQILALRTALQ